MIRPTQASKLDRDKSPDMVSGSALSPIYFFTSSAAILAMITFLNSPIQKRERPALKSFRFSLRPSISCSTWAYRIIGPATNEEKRDTYIKKSGKFLFITFLQYREYYSACIVYHLFSGSDEKCKNCNFL